MGTEFKGPITEREPNTTSDARHWYSHQPAGNDPDYVSYFNDFKDPGNDLDVTNDWTVTTTEAGAGSATEAITAGARAGELAITNDDADNDLDSIQHKNESWSLTSGKKLWFETRIKIEDADTEDAFIGLAITDTTPLDASDAVGFRVETTDASLQCECTKNSTTTQKDSEQDLSDDTYVKLGIYYNGSSTVYFYVDRTLVATIETNLPDDENLCITFHHQNGDAAADAMTIDYVKVVMER